MRPPAAQTIPQRQVGQRQQVEQRDEQGLISHCGVVVFYLQRGEKGIALPPWSVCFFWMNSWWTKEALEKLDMLKKTCLLIVSQTVLMLWRQGSRRTHLIQLHSHAKRQSEAKLFRDSVTGYCRWILVFIFVLTQLITEGGIQNSIFLSTMWILSAAQGGSVRDMWNGQPFSFYDVCHKIIYK